MRTIARATYPHSIAMLIRSYLCSYEEIPSNYKITTPAPAYVEERSTDAYPQRPFMHSDQEDALRGQQQDAYEAPRSLDVILEASAELMQQLGSSSVSIMINI